MRRSESCIAAAGCRSKPGLVCRDFICGGGFAGLFRNLILQPQRQKLMLDLNGRRDLQPSSKPECPHHWLTATAAASRPSMRGTRTGGTNQPRAFWYRVILRSFRTGKPGKSRAPVSPEGPIVSAASRNGRFTSAAQAFPRVAWRRPGSAAAQAWSRPVPGSSGLRWSPAVDWT